MVKVRKLFLDFCIFPEYCVRWIYMEWLTIMTFYVRKYSNESQNFFKNKYLAYCLECKKSGWGKIGEIQFSFMVYHITFLRSSYFHLIQWKLNFLCINSCWSNLCHSTNAKTSDFIRIGLFQHKKTLQQQINFGSTRNFIRFYFVFTIKSNLWGKYNKPFFLGMLYKYLILFNSDFRNFLIHHCSKILSQVENMLPDYDIL